VVAAVAVEKRNNRRSKDHSNFYKIKTTLWWFFLFPIENKKRGYSITHSEL
jgi:hypothetical protein